MLCALGLIRRNLVGCRCRRINEANFSLNFRRCYCSLVTAKTIRKRHYLSKIQGKHPAVFVFDMAAAEEVDMFFVLTTTNGIFFLP